ncbi:MAG TPA: hypothetical protein VFR04_02565 [Solirubrobacterales bacterium]|nr:hypothetical protein [Solirubrobacterales bacterium]
MSFARHLLVLTCALALLAASVLGAAAASAAPSGAGASVSKKGKAKGKKCPKGKKPVSVKRNGKKVTICKKKAKPKPVPPPTPAPAQGLFPDPGRTLEEAEAKEYLKPYLPNSTFTDCVPGWPACGGFENRYSHSAGSTFYQCWLRPTSGSDVKSVGEYGVQKARVNPDGSWLVQEIVSWYGHYNLFEWQVSDSGVVNGANQSDSGGAPEKIGPLQYVGGIAKDCSY